MKKQYHGCTLYISVQCVCLCFKFFISMKEFAEKLLESKTVEFYPHRTCSSLSEGAISCYLERAYGDAEVSYKIISALENLVQKMCDEYGTHISPVIVSSSARACGWGFGVAYEHLRLPFAYALKTKDGFRFEGACVNGYSRVIVVVDFVCNGYTVLNVVDAVRATGAIVVGVVAIVCSGTRTMHEAFDAAHVLFKSATDFKELQEIAKANDAE